MTQQPSRAREEKEIVVFSIVRDGTCAECGRELSGGEFLRMEAQRPLCMSCADLDRLVFLGSGDAALTRRASKYSSLRAVVIRFSPGPQALRAAGRAGRGAGARTGERECLADADVRRFARERAAERRQELDAEYVEAFARRIGELFPGCPDPERQEIAEHACRKYSGRVGRSAAAKALEEEAVTLAVRAHVRHVHTPYDRLLARGYDRTDARQQVAGLVDEQLDAWRAG